MWRLAIGGGGGSGRGLGVGQAVEGFESGLFQTRLSSHLLPQLLHLGSWHHTCRDETHIDWLTDSDWVLGGWLAFGWLAMVDCLTQTGCLVSFWMDGSGWLTDSDWVLGGWLAFGWLADWQTHWLTGWKVSNWSNLALLHHLPAGRETWENTVGNGRRARWTKSSNSHWRKQQPTGSHFIHSLDGSIIYQRWPVWVALHCKARCDRHKAVSPVVLAHQHNRNGSCYIWSSKGLHREVTTRPQLPSPPQPQGFQVGTESEGWNRGSRPASVKWAISTTKTPAGLLTKAPARVQQRTGQTEGKR